MTQFPPPPFGQPQPQWQPPIQPQQWRPPFGQPPPQWQPPIQPPQQRPPATNVAAIIAISCALIGLVVLPILLGPVAIVAGVVGEHQARAEGRKMAKVSLLAIVIGAIVTLIAVDRVMTL